MKLNPCKNCKGTSITPRMKSNSGNLVLTCDSCKRMVTVGQDEDISGTDKWNQENPIE